MEINILPISGFYFEDNGWVKNNFTWVKGENKVTYDGCVWLLNGQQVEYTYEIENQLNETRTYFY